MTTLVSIWRACRCDIGGWVHRLKADPRAYTARQFISNLSTLITDGAAVAAAIFIDRAQFGGRPPVWPCSAAIAHASRFLAPILLSYCPNEPHGKKQDMMNFWHEGRGGAPALCEAEVMAATLEAYHGIYAAEIAEFFSILHTSRGNASRGHAWAEVADAVRDRIGERIRS